MRVISLSNASGVTIDGASYTPGDDGVFDFPEPVGVELTTKHASMWVAEAVHAAAMTAAELDRLRDPNQMVAAVADLLKRVATLEAQAAPASKAPKAQAPASTPAPTAEGPSAAPKQPRKQAAAKKAEPSKQTAKGDSDSTATPGAPAGTDPATPEQPVEQSGDAAAS